MNGKLSFGGTIDPFDSKVEHRKNEGMFPLV
jgi:hypothetical protein